MLPLLMAGADGVLAEVTRQAGEKAAATARRVLDLVRGSVRPDDPTRDEVTSALRKHLDAGEFSTADLAPLLQAVGGGNRQVNVKVKGNAYVDTNIRVDGGGSFNG